MFRSILTTEVAGTASHTQGTGARAGEGAVGTEAVRTGPAGLYLYLYMWLAFIFVFAGTRARRGGREVKRSHRGSQTFLPLLSSRLL